MTEQNITDKLNKDLKDKIVSWEEKNPRRHYFRVKKNDLVWTAEYLFEKMKARFITASGVDTPRGIEILYHFSLDRQAGQVVTVKVVVAKDKCEVESVAPLIPGAAWIEREIRELLGVTFLNHPDPRPLLTAEDWPEGKFPLRADYRDTDFTGKEK